MFFSRPIPAWNRKSQIVRTRTLNRGQVRAKPRLERLEDRIVPDSGSTWTMLAPAGGPPIARWLQTGVEDQANDRMIIFGGTNTLGSSGQMNDVWVLANADGIGGAPTWTQLNPTGTVPSARLDASAAYDSATNRMILFGGDLYQGFSFGTTNDLWVLTNANGLAGAPA
jgi:hypothetical protein